MAELRREFESLNQFVTLSPLPQFASWLARQPSDSADNTEESALMGLAACYLLHEKSSGSVPLDPVARFHLGNGAHIHALHANADTSQNGQARSHGVMVNYLYDLKQLEANHQKFLNDGDIACSNKVKEAADTARARLRDTD